MAYEKACAPLGGYWSSPFCRWQGNLAAHHPLELAAGAVRAFLGNGGVEAAALDGLHLGQTVPAKGSFYGAPWVAGMAGWEGLTGPSVNQACGTSVRLLRTAASEVEAGVAGALLTVAADRTSNGPHLVYPQPKSPGGTVLAEDWVWDNFQRDPHAKSSMLQTAENVASAHGFTTEEQHSVALLRYEQYLEATADDRAFQKRYMLPMDGGKAGPIEVDEGVFPTTAEGLAKLRPVVEGGTVTFGGQTHPADGNAGMIVATPERAAEMFDGSEGLVRFLGFGEARTEIGRMPQAAVPAARRALANAGRRLEDVAAFKIHDPFAVNDLYFCRELGLDLEQVNRFGCSLVYGHPQAPTGLRGVVELIEELRLRGGGIGLFSGCSAGDSAAAVVLEVA